MCIKTGELDLALDVFQQLLREGCTPNLVTYNILIDVRLLPASCCCLQTLCQMRRLARRQQCSRHTVFEHSPWYHSVALRVHSWSSGAVVMKPLALHMCCTALHSTSHRPDDDLPSAHHPADAPIPTLQQALYRAAG